MEKAEYYHFLDKRKIENASSDGFEEYVSIFRNLIINNNKDLKDFIVNDVIISLLKYISLEVDKLNKKYREITLCEKYSEYSTFILIKNKNLLKKEFKKILTELSTVLKDRDGGDLINIQFKDVNLILYIHKNE